MSAVFGILNLDRRPVEDCDMQGLATALAHRSIDGIRYAIHGPVGLGHGLMQITEEDRFELQPVFDPEMEVTLVADLRLDNRAELAATLNIDAASLRDMPDSALVLRAYKAWGDGCAQHLIGDFVFALWNERTKRLLIARDHLGQRICFYHVGKSAFVFASEVKALWTHADVPRELSDVGIARMLTLDLGGHEGETIFQDIRSLEGGTTLVVELEARRISQRSYWSPRPSTLDMGRSEDHYVEAYRAVLEEAVSCRLRRLTRPAGLLLSGGYDSSAVAALAGPTMKSQGRKLVAICSAMPQDYRGSIRHSRPWVEMCRRHMTHLDVRYVTRDHTDVLAGLELVFPVTEAMPSVYSVIRGELYAPLAAAGVRVVMDGYGGDQTINPRGKTALAYLLATGQWARFAVELSAYMRMTRSSLMGALRSEVLGVVLQTKFPNLRNLVRRRFGLEAGTPVISAEFAKRMAAHGVIAGDRVRGGFSTLDPVSQLAEFQRRRMTRSRSTAEPAAFGLEPTSPFFDKRVAELALAIPPELHAKNGRSRYLACRALADLYPPEFQTRGRKNDDQFPDLSNNIKAAERRLAAELARMEEGGTVARYVDLANVRQLIASCDPDRHESGWDQNLQLGLVGLSVARFVEWFRRYN